MATRTAPRRGEPVRSNFAAPSLPVDHRRLPTLGHGEAVLLWACGDCGELGDVRRLPGDCPACGADRTAVGFVVED
jgi:rubrerythrin